MNITKRLLVTLYCFCAGLSLFSQTVYSKKSWSIFETAERAFDQAEYGQAVKLLQESKELRIQETAAVMRELHRILQLPEIRLAGDSVDAVMQVLRERAETEVLVLFDSLLSHDDFNNSLAELTAYAGQRKSFPEADFMLAKIYTLEGEYAVAVDYFESALRNAAVLDIPDMRFDILYAMADLEKEQKHAAHYKEILTQIVINDPRFSPDNENKPADSIAASLKTVSDANKFFLLYRNSSYQFISAYLQLAECCAAEDPELAVRYSIMGILSAVTRIETIVKERNQDYMYTTIQALVKESCQYQDVLDWYVSYDIWNGFFICASLCRPVNPQFSTDLFNLLYLYCPEPYWSKRALLELRS